MEQAVQRTIAHVLCNDTEELWLVAHTVDLDDVVEPGFVEYLSLLQQAISLPAAHTHIHTRTHARTHTRAFSVASVI